MAQDRKFARGAEDTFPPNPNYGTGCYRRRIRLIPEDGAVLAMLDDTNHAMWARIFHDGSKVTGTEGETIRAPNSNCPFAYKALQELIDLPLGMPRSDLYAEGRPIRNCTHMFDAAALAIKYGGRFERMRVYDVMVPDQKYGPVVAEVAIDGRQVLRWKVHGPTLLEFEETHGPVPIMKGFTRWAVEALEGELLEAAFVLQPAYFVSSARNFIVDQMKDLPITRLPELTGACYAYQPERIEEGMQVIGNVRDFTDELVEYDAELTRQR